MALFPRQAAHHDQTFSGQILGVGSTSGVRVVVGRWLRSPWGPFADVMVETPAGHRVLLAPDERVREFVSATYTFDETRIENVVVQADEQTWRVDTPSLRLVVTTGRRTALGRLLRVVPRRLATHPRWAGALDPVARRVLDGVRTRGTAREGRQEFYGATDLHAVLGVEGRFDEVELGALADVDPPCRFGFSSTPRRPGLTDVTTTVRLVG